MYVILFSGPEPIVIPIMNAANEGDASAQAMAALSLYLKKFDKPWKPDEFRVEKVTAA